MLVRTILLISISCLIGCQSNSTEQMRPMDLDKINLSLLSKQKQTPSVNSGLMSLLEESNYIIPSSENISINLSKNRENNSYTALIENHSVPGDDSIKSYKYLLNFNRNKEDYWVVTEAKESWSCWPERGHQDFSTESCL